MRRLEQYINRLLFILITQIIVWTNSFSQNDAVDKYDTLIRAAQERALAMLSSTDTVTASAFWPNIKPSLFFANIRKNIQYPAKINQGKATNFCGYAAFTHILIKYQPDTYTRIILSFYRTGKADLYRRQVKPSQRVRESAGLLKRKGELDILHADQLWFLTMADTYKGYLNIFDHKYKIGDENTFWAATNYGKFNRMLREFGDYKVREKGSDMIRPWEKDLFGYLAQQLDTGIVMMYINSKLTHPTKYSFFRLPAPTHFVVLYDLYREGDLIQIKYWDYGLKTEQVITKKRLKKMTFGVSTITEK
ncbi:MAG TPA: hypothetical protein VJ765_04075 [Chitinophagaceae bacterium]|nr:hypothetical protein [Chitinophagaceae bacterium]